MHMSVTLLPLSILALLGALIISGFYVGRLGHFLRLPSLLGYMLVGIIVGPSALGFLSNEHLALLSFIPELGLGFVALSIGLELKIASLKRFGIGIVSIIFTESFGAFVAVTGAMYLATGDLPLAILFGAVAPASAPAGTVAVIQEYRAKGTMTKALYAVVGFDDGLAIIIYGFAAMGAKALLLAMNGGTPPTLLSSIWQPFAEIACSVLLGGLSGVGFGFLLRNIRRSKDLLVLLVGAVLLLTGLAKQLHFSYILTNMAFGFVMANVFKPAVIKRLQSPMSELMPLIFLLFFCLAGAHVNLSASASLGILGGIYIIARSVGLIGGVYLGGTIAGVEPKIRKYLGLGILSQAGVAIGLALITKQEFGGLAEVYGIGHAEEIGRIILTSVMATAIFFEILGPLTTKYSLQKAGEIPPDTSNEEK